MNDDVRLPPTQVFEAGERNHHISNTAYPIAHDLTWKPYRVARSEQRRVAESAWRGIEDLCLYAHIPFCEVRCSFCEYTVVNPLGRERQRAGDETEAYMDRLEHELDLWSFIAGRLHGFDIGGGTPAFVSEKRIARLVEKVHQRFERAPGYGISIETTPKIAAAEPDKMRAFYDAGIERISMGIQVIQPDLLRVLNRSGNGVEHHHRAVEHIRNAGFRRFNVDVMYGFADQSMESWRATLAHAIALGPEYITLYRMRYKLTRISDQASRVRMDDVRAQSALAKEMLREAGYWGTPGKNTYSKIPGDVGTSEYLTRRVIDGMPYLGLGLGAQSFTHTTISYADGAVGKNLLPYFRSVDADRLPLQDLYDLPPTQMMAKFVAVSFYFGEIDYAAFEAKFGVTVEQAFPAEVAWVKEQGLMEDKGKTLGLTQEGAKHFNGVIALFFAPSVQQYLVDRYADEDMHKNRRLALAVG